MAVPSVPLPNGHISAPSVPVHRLNGSANGSISSSHPTHPTLSIQHANGMGSYRSPTRVDLGTIKQELHDALGENGLPYWKALNGYLLGQIGKSEMESMVKGWLKGKIDLHNRLLLSLLHNASIPLHSAAPVSPLAATSRKRKRVGPDDPEFDTDPNIIEPKSRVVHWYSGIHPKERSRTKRGWTRTLQSEEDKEAPAMEDVWAAEKRRMGMQASNTMPPLAASAKLLPSSHQLVHRLSQLAKGYDLNIPPDAQNEIGEFLSVGVDAHMADILHAHVHLTARDRPGFKTIRVRPGADSHDESKMEPGELDGEVPPAELDSLRALVDLYPQVHAATSPALFKLGSGVTSSERDYNAPPARSKAAKLLDGGLAGGGYARIGGREKNEDRVNRYLKDGLIKIDSAKEEKKDKKHSSHWKYEDPALILGDFLG